MEYYNYYKGEIQQILQSEEAPDSLDYVAKYKDSNNQEQIIRGYTSGNKLDVGDKVYIREAYSTTTGGYIMIGDKVRNPEIILSLLLLFVVVITIFGRKGLKALFSLAISFIVIFGVLIPLMIKGYNPILVSAGVATGLLALSMFITHGIKKYTVSALMGCSVSILITVLFSYFIVWYSKISGYMDEGSYYIQSGFNGDGSQINLSFLIVASIIIGVVGAVDDGAITQAKIVQEIKSLNKNLSPYQYYKRAMNVGLDHGGAMINTLVLAFVASSIPDLMFIYKSEMPLYVLLSTEQVSTEIFRACISSIGLLLAIPLTTLISIKLINEDDIKDYDASHHPTHKH